MSVATSHAAAPLPSAQSLPPTPSKSPAGRGPKAGRQQGLTSFFKQTAKCLSCRQPIQSGKAAVAGPLSPGSSSGSSRRGTGQQEPGLLPALCDTCAGEEDCWAQVYLGTLQEDSRQWQALCSAQGACLRCHSGGGSGAVLCENAECPVLYPRLGAARALAASEAKLERLELSCGW
jgi:hypothetical protein